VTWVVYLLLALNLGWLTWNLHMRSATLAAPTAPVLAPAVGGVGQLPLLTELNADTLRLRVSATKARAGTATPAVAPDVSPSAVSEATSVTTESAVAAVTADLPTSPEIEVSTASVADHRAVPSAAHGAAETSDAALGDAAVTSVVPRACLTLGPLSADAPLEDMRAWLQSTGTTVDVRTDERREVALYWVYFPPRTSREKAVAEVERLRNEGITDVIAVPKGDMANAISLGVFSLTDSRDRRVKEMNQRGYQPSVAPRYRVKRATWIDLSAPLGMLPEQNIRSRWPEVELRQQPCSAEPVALDKKAAEAIAVARAPSYNAHPAEPRRFHYSGSAASRLSATADASQ
jgi:hypothetical protein